MNPLCMLDTNICIHIMRHKRPEVRTRFDQFQTGQLVMSAITYGELFFGVAKSGDRPRAEAQLQIFAEAVPPLPLGKDAAEKYGEIRALLESQGRAIGNNDIWIGAHALALGITLATTNEREFRRIPQLTVENWSK